MSMCGICHGRIEDGEPYDEEHLSYDGCEGNNLLVEEYLNR